MNSFANNFRHVIFLCTNNLFLGENEKERERELVAAEMIPSKGTKLGLWERFWELQYKIIFSSPNTQNVHSHMYSSEPLDWPLMVRGVAYWLSEHDNVSKFNLLHIIHHYI